MERFKWVVLDGCKTDLIISDHGRLISLNYYRKGIIQQLKTYLNKDCHLEVAVKFKGKNHMIRIHKLVAESFVPNPDNKTEVHHLDGNPINNHYKNLLWVTPDEHHMLTSNLHQYDIRFGDDNPVTKFNRDQILRACKLLIENKLSIKDISKATCIPYYVVTKLKNDPDYRKCDKAGLDLSVYDKNQNYKYSDDIIRNTCLLLEKYHKDGTLLKEPEVCYANISNKLGISVPAVKSIKLRKRRVKISKDYSF